MAAYFSESFQSAGTPILTITGPYERPKLNQTLEEALHSPIYSDITLVARGGSLKANKIILATQCTKLTSQMTSAIDKLTLDMDVNILKIVISYIYVNRADIPEASLQEVEKATKYLGVEELLTKCIKAQLNKPLTVDNCFNIWVKASEIQDENIVEEVQGFALQNFFKLHKSAAFRALPYNLLKEYILHPSLKTRNQEEKLGSVLTWVRADSEARAAMLPALVDALPLTKMSQWFLDHLLSDPMIQNLPQAVNRINQALKKERCLISVAANFEGKGSNEVKAIRLWQNLEILTLGRTKGKSPNTYTNCIMLNDVVYACGMGGNRDEVWCFNMKDLSSKRLIRLNTPRRGHTLARGPDGCVLIIGGYTSDDEDLSSIEVIDVTTGTCSEAGHLKHKDAYRLACCHLQGGEIVAVCGARDNQGYNTIQAYNTKTLTTTHSVKLQDTSTSCVYGVVELSGHLIVVAEFYTAVVSVDDFIHGRTTTLTLSKHYVTPNDWCAVVPSEDDSSLLLLGGKRKSGQPKHYTYSAQVDDMLKDIGSGWHQVNTLGTMGMCEFTGGYDISCIDIPET